MDDNFKKEIVSYIEKAMRPQKFSKIKVDLTGTTTKGEGFMADLIFAAVTETDKDTTFKEFHLAIKLGKRSKEMRENLPEVIDCYKRELFLYDTVLPAFRQFQLEKKVVDIFDAYPKCYGTVVSDDTELLILENMKKRGFILHDKQSTMNLQHLQLVLKSYAKLHALSFAFRGQHRDEYNKVTADYDSIYIKLLPNWIMSESDPRVQLVLREAGRDDLAVKYVEETKNNECSTLLSLLEDVPQESVILHGDCHNNNFLFEYEGSDEENPLRVTILDWQLSGIHSPVLDLSYFFYSTASRKDLFHLDELLKFYYSHLTDFLKQLGSDAQEVFPYSTLVEHWRKYAIFGFTVGKVVLRSFYIPEDQTPEISGNKELDEDKQKNVKLQNEDVYKERLISSFDQYFNFSLS